MVAWLIRQGYTILATNLRLGSLEIDIVARLGPVVAVVEVRSRGSGAWTTPFGSVTATKRQRLRRAGLRLWQRQFKRNPEIQRLRFDVAAVTWANGEPNIEYAPAAF